MESDDIKAGTDKASEKFTASIRPVKDRAAAETAKAAQGAQTTANHLAGSVKETFGRVQDQVAGLSDKLPGSASDAYQAGQRVVAGGADTVSASVAKQPIEALLLAGALGYLVGWATSRS